MNEHMQTLILKHLYWPLLQVWKKQCKVLQALKVLNFQCQLDTKLEPSIYHTFSHIKTHSEISPKKKTHSEKLCLFYSTPLTPSHLSHHQHLFLSGNKQLSSSLLVPQTPFIASLSSPSSFALQFQL